LVFDVKPSFWIAPALGCLLLLMTVGGFMTGYQNRSSIFLGTARVTADQELEERLTQAIQTHLNSGQNVLQIAFFASTNARSWPSSNNSFGLLTTKGLRN
jgi:hypothetical protein